MNKPALMTSAKRMGSDNGLFILSVFDLEPSGVIVQAYSQVDSKEYLLPVTEMELAEAGLTRHKDSLKGLLDSIQLVAQGTTDFVLESSYEQISKIKKRPRGDELKEMMEKPMTDGGDSFQEFLVTSLMELCRNKPTGLDAVEWLGQWLIENNPNRPVVEIPDE
jgi:hypothetical protein